MSSFKIELLKALGNYKYSHFPPPQKTMLKSGWLISDPAWTTLTRPGEERDHSGTKSAE